jgi:hypothetical protein
MTIEIITNAIPTHVALRSCFPNGRRTKVLGRFAKMTMATPIRRSGKPIVVKFMIKGRVCLTSCRSQAEKWSRYSPQYPHD